MHTRRKVLVLGAGVAGMTAAHELIERGYEVTVVESGFYPGGKAATQYPWVDLRDKGRFQVPAEHGFRLFPTFYRHVIDSMERIPFYPSDQPSLGARPRIPRKRGGKLGRAYHTVAENLQPTPTAAMARNGYKPQHVPRAYGGTIDGILRLLRDAVAGEQFYERRETDVQQFQVKTLQFLTSCQKRRDSVDSPVGYGRLTWWEYLGADEFSPAFQQEVDTFIRTMVAMEARTGNARTIGNVGMQLLLDLSGDGSRVDRVFNGPSSDQWLLPWEAYLANRGVKFLYGTSVTALDYDPARHRVVCVRTRNIDGHEEIYQYANTGAEAGETEFHHVIAALPVNAMKGLLSSRRVEKMVNADPHLKWIRDLDLERYTAWMAGIQFYLERDVPIVHGHVYYPEADWKLSSVSQAQFWGPDFFRTYGCNQYGGILSVDVCDWEWREGRHTPAAFKKVAQECENAEVVAREIWAQLRFCLTADNQSLLPKDYLGFHLDDYIQFPEKLPGREVGEVDRKGDGPKRLAHNSSPYFIHPAGSHVERPTANTNIKNLFLAGDYVLTVTDLATMEGANEAARRAVNAILDVDFQDGGEGCTLFQFDEPAQLDYIKSLDRDLFDRGEPHIFEMLGLVDQIRNATSPHEADRLLGLAASSINGVQYLAAKLPGAFPRLS